MSGDGHKRIYTDKEIALVTSFTQNKVNLTVGGCSVLKALLDTGASISVASSDFISKTSLANEKLLPPTHGRIKGVTGNF